MKSEEKARKIGLLLAIHSYIFISTFIITLLGVTKGAGDGQVGKDMINLGYFKAYTMDSNILAGITSFLYVVILCICLYKKIEKMPRFVVVLQLMSAISVGLTFVIVVIFLAPKQVMQGKSYFIEFTEDLFFYHFLNPLLVIAAFIFGEKEYHFKTKENLIGLIPTFIYSFVYAYCVLVTKVWSDFYGFTFGGKISLVAPVTIVIYLLSFLIGFILIKAKNRYVASK